MKFQVYPFFSVLSCLSLIGSASAQVPCPSDSKPTQPLQKAVCDELIEKYRSDYAIAHVVYNKDQQLGPDAANWRDLHAKGLEVVNQFLSHVNPETLKLIRLVKAAQKNNVKEEALSALKHKLEESLAYEIAAKSGGNLVVTPMVVTPMDDFPYCKNDFDNIKLNYQGSNKCKDKSSGALSDAAHTFTKSVTLVASNDGITLTMAQKSPAELARDVGRYDPDDHRNALSLSYTLTLDRILSCAPATPEEIAQNWIDDYSDNKEKLMSDYEAFTQSCKKTKEFSDFRNEIGADFDAIHRDVLNQPMSLYNIRRHLTQMSENSYDFSKVTAAFKKKGLLTVPAHFADEDEELAYRKKFESWWAYETQGIPSSEKY